jgi:hypothetical protein
VAPGAQRFDVRRGMSRENCKGICLLIQLDTVGFEIRQTCGQHDRGHRDATAPRDLANLGKQSAIKPHRSMQSFPKRRGDKDDLLAARQT